MMQRRSLHLIFLFVSVTALFSSSSAQAQLIHGRGHHNHRGVFPFVTRVRDSCIEWLFGKQFKSDRSYGPTTARYAAETVIRFNVTTADEETALAEAVDRLFLDVWAFNNQSGFVDIRLKKDRVAPLLSLLPNSLHQAFSTLVPDLGAAVWATYPSSKATPIVSGPRLENDEPISQFAILRFDPDNFGTDNIFFQDYQPLPVITRWMNLLEALFAHVSLVNVGKSAEGRDIVGMRVGKPQNETKKTMLITGGLHAREWISTSTVNYLAWSLISTYGKDRVVTGLLDKYDVVLLPVVNPDRYDYTWNSDRLWRKTRQDTNLRFCRGLDLDHAFGFEWDASKPEPCSESYGGEEAFQAVEAKALAEWAKNETAQGNTEFIAYLDLHSYSQQIMYPFSFSCDEYPSNYENLTELAYNIAAAVRRSTGERYGISSACEGIVGHAARGSGSRIESGGGSAIDWFYHELKATYSYQIKLRDTGSYGFLLPSSHIVPTGEEMFTALKYFSNFIMGNNGVELDADEVPEEQVELKRRWRRR